MTETISSAALRGRAEKIDARGPSYCSQRQAKGDAGSDWAAAVKAARRGDEAEYRRFLQNVRVWLCRYYKRRLSAASAEDATQEALIAVHVKLHTYDDKRPFGPWLGAIARYKWIDRLRALKSGGNVMNEDLTVPDHAEAVMNAVILNGLLSSLKLEQSAVIRLVKLQGMSVEEASRNTGQSISLVKVNIYRGLARLTALAQRSV